MFTFVNYLALIEDEAYAKGLIQAVEPGFSEVNFVCFRNG